MNEETITKYPDAGVGSLALFDCFAFTTASKKEPWEISCDHADEYPFGLWRGSIADGEKVAVARTVDDLCALIRAELEADVADAVWHKILEWTETWEPYLSNVRDQGHLPACAVGARKGSAE